MNRNQTLKTVQSIKDLPTLPVIVLEINRLLQDDDTPVDSLVELLAKDQSLVMKMLKLVNSSFFGFKSRVKSLRHAVTLMGFNTIRNAVVTVAVMDTLTMKRELHGFEIDAFWKHAIRVAVLSRFFALRTALIPAEDAFTCGLLHDVGKIIQANYFTDELTQIIDAVQAQGLPFHQVESQLGFFPHGSIGASLAERWLLPGSLIKAIQYHHQPAAVQNRDNSDCDESILVGLANTLDHMMAAHSGYGLNLEGSPQKVKDIAAEVVKEGYRSLSELKREMDAACSFFNK